MPESVRGRIDRYHRDLEKEHEREEAGKRPLTEETDVVEFFKRLGFRPTAYQEKLLRDKSKLILARWSRQSGNSLVMAGIVLFNALTERGFRAAIVAPSLRQSRKLIDKIDRLIPRLGIDVLEGLPRKGKLTFRNGSVIEALPNSPDTIRGETLNMVVADEFAYIEHDKELYDAVIFTLSTTNGPFFATSTPGSRDTLFYDMATDDDIFGDFSRHHVSYREALKPAGPIDPEFLERIRKQYQTDRGRWTREMEVELADGEDASLPRELIESCVMGTIEARCRNHFILAGGTEDNGRSQTLDAGRKPTHPTRSRANERDEQRASPALKDWPATVLTSGRDPRRQTLGSRTGSLRSKKRNHPIPSSSSPRQEPELHRTHVRLATP